MRKAARETAAASCILALVFWHTETDPCSLPLTCAGRRLIWLIPFFERY